MNLQMKNFEKILIVVVIATTLVSAYSLTRCFLSDAELKEANKIINNQQVNTKVVAFAQLFIDKVLSGSTEVSFEDRLQLENAVRGINDQEIFDQWQKFVKSETNGDSQHNLSELLKLLVKKISF